MGSRKNPYIEVSRAFHPLSTSSALVHPHRQGPRPQEVRKAIRKLAEEMHLRLITNVRLMVKKDGSHRLLHLANHLFMREKRCVARRSNDS